MTALSTGALARAAELLEVEPSLLRVQPVGGGCISPAARVAGGPRTVFVKSAAPDAPRGLFDAEAAGLQLLASARAVRVPTVLSVSPDALVLEWLEPGAADAATWRALGAQLARLHRTTGPAYGLDRDNYIGPLPQPNGWMQDWPAFFRERRILPQLELVLEKRLLDEHERRELIAFVDVLDQLLADVATEGASLLHGDLWRGNALPLAVGGSALVDPACYYGHREIDLAMAELFGGFPAAFYESYEAIWPTHAATRARRRAAYRAYYLLVHINLFGRSYVSGTLEAVRAACG